jgi:ABC-type multidrug transport system permease subunit
LLDVDSFFGNNSNFEFIVYDEIEFNYDICLDKMFDSIKSDKTVFGIFINSTFSSRIKDNQVGFIDIYYDNSEPSIDSIASWKFDSAIVPLKHKIIRNSVHELKENVKELESGIYDLDSAYNSLNDEKLILEEEFDLFHSDIKDTKNKISRISNMDENFVASPIVTKTNGIYDNLSSLSIGFPGLFCLTCLFIVLMLCSTGIIYDKKMYLFQRIKSSNSIFLSYFIGKYIFYFLICFFQFLIILIIFYFAGARFEINLLSLLICILLITLIDVSIGFLIGLLSESEGIAVLISLMFTLPMMFLSGLFFPVELMPKIIQFIAKILPLSIEVSLLKRALFFSEFTCLIELFFWNYLIFCLLVFFRTY